MSERHPGISPPTSDQATGNENTPDEPLLVTSYHSVEDYIGVAEADLDALGKRLAA